MFTSSRTTRPLQEYKVPRRRRVAKRKDAVEIERLEADFWTHFNLEKFATDWRRGVGKRSR